ncbi:glycerophosphoryl diester phosphodiesterase [Deinococcus reticulitermitis]|uniref:Glycerophosphoryl diester phosphodiesterase n=1 Tax=Deinococcus reticulitermitis TaxID=856736 RepID=A0A1H6W9N8_9DEIO|nr:glycerophosphodiester phosphodiesterase [Deinococcus reticulitermitis]SEJ13739.1 glycerophosphoryl diester phosphodiesterase [Deinococcus reticulitermitis]
MPKPCPGLPASGLAALGLLALAGCAATSSAPAPNPYLTGRTLNIAHQGGELLWPSNTMLAYREAVGLGVDMLEMDMHATRDGALVLSHDDTLDRLTDTRGRIREMTLEEVLRADAGYRLTPVGGEGFPFRGQGVQVAQLRDVLREFPNTPMIIELKQVSPSIAAPFCAALREAGAQKSVIAASFSDAALNEFRQVCPEVMTSMTEKELRPLVLLSKVGLSGLARAPGQVAQVPVRAGGIEVVTPAFIRAMHARGVAVQVWTINDEAEMRRLIALGVDGLITDRPDLLKRVLAER